MVFYCLWLGNLLWENKQHQAIDQLNWEPKYFFKTCTIWCIVVDDYYKYETSVNKQLPYKIVKRQPVDS